MSCFCVIVMHTCKNCYFLLCLPAKTTGLTGFHLTYLSFTFVSLQIKSSGLLETLVFPLISMESKHSALKSNCVEFVIYSNLLNNNIFETLFYCFFIAIYSFFLLD